MNKRENRGIMNKRESRKGESNNSPGVSDRRVTSEVPGVGKTLSITDSKSKDFRLNHEDVSKEL